MWLYFNEKLFCVNHSEVLEKFKQAQNYAADQACEFVSLLETDRTDESQRCRWVWWRAGRSTYSIVGSKLFAFIRASKYVANTSLVYVYIICLIRLAITLLMLTSLVCVPIIYLIRIAKTLSWYKLAAYVVANTLLQDILLLRVSTQRYVYVARGRNYSITSDTLSK